MAHDNPERADSYALAAHQKAILIEIKEIREAQIARGFTRETDQRVFPATWRQERDVQEVRALAVDRTLSARRRALLKIAALALAQIEAFDSRKGAISL